MSRDSRSNDYGDDEYPATVLNDEIDESSAYVRDEAAIQRPPSDALAKIDEDAFSKTTKSLKPRILDAAAKRNHRSRRTSKCPQSRRCKS